MIRALALGIRWFAGVLVFVLVLAGCQTAESPSQPPAAPPAVSEAGSSTDLGDRPTSPVR